MAKKCGLPPVVELDTLRAVIPLDWSQPALSFAPRSACPRRRFMSPQRLHRLKEQYTGSRVLVDSQRPELSRFANTPGRIVTVNGNGLALVQFDGPDRGWHDIALESLRLENLS
jgi:hypothetical protein